MQPTVNKPAISRPTCGAFLLTSTFVVAATAGLAACGGTQEDDVTTPPGTPAAGVTCPTRGALVIPTMPTTINPPAEAQLFLRVYAEGSQIYTCQVPAAGGAPAWVFKAPEAKLYDDRCVLMGTHFAGPTWKIDNDGSAVVGKKVSESPGEGVGSIPWLLLSTNTTMGAGTFAPVTFINRIDTVGGTAPSSGCDAGTVGQELKVPYTATYLYYR